MYSILKIPFDMGNVSAGKRGASSAPNEILKNVPEVTNVIDVNVSPGNFDETQENITAAALKELRQGRRIIGLGGDHSVSYGLVRAFAKRYSDFGLIYFDAHLDCEDDFLTPTHEDVVKALVNQGFVKPENLLIIGVRKSWPKEEAFVKEKNITVIRSCEQEQVLTAVKEFSKRFNYLYVSVDIDVLDPLEAPGTGYKEQNGMETKVLREALKSAGLAKIRGIDLVEISPQLDYSSKTVAAGANLLKDFLTP